MPMMLKMRKPIVSAPTDVAIAASNRASGRLLSAPRGVAVGVLSLLLMACAPASAEAVRSGAEHGAHWARADDDDKGKKKHQEKHQEKKRVKVIQRGGEGDKEGLKEEIIIDANGTRLVVGPKGRFVIHSGDGRVLSADKFAFSFSGDEDDDFVVDFTGSFSSLGIDDLDIDIDLEFDDMEGVIVLEGDTFRMRPRELTEEERAELDKAKSKIDEQIKRLKSEIAESDNGYAKNALKVALMGLKAARDQLEMQHKMRVFNRGFGQGWARMVEEQVRHQRNRTYDDVRIHVEELKDQERELIIMRKEMAAEMREARREIEIELRELRDELGDSETQVRLSERLKERAESDLEDLEERHLEALKRAELELRAKRKVLERRLKERRKARAKQEREERKERKADK